MMLILRVNPDVVHVNYNKTYSLSGLVSFFFKKTKFIYAISGLGFTFSSEGIKSNVRKFFILNLYKLILCNKNYKIIFKINLI